jgi:hypothetical protein
MKNTNYMPEWRIACVGAPNLLTAINAVAQKSVCFKVNILLPA